MYAEWPNCAALGLSFVKMFQTIQSLHSLALNLWSICRGLRLCHIWLCIAILRLSLRPVYVVNFQGMEDILVVAPNTSLARSDCWIEENLFEFCARVLAVQEWTVACLESITLIFDGITAISFWRRLKLLVHKFLHGFALARAELVEHLSRTQVVSHMIMHSHSQIITSSCLCRQFSRYGGHFGCGSKYVTGSEWLLDWRKSFWILCKGLSCARMTSCMSWKHHFDFWRHHGHFVLTAAQAPGSQVLTWFYRKRQW